MIFDMVFTSQHEEVTDYTGKFNTWFNLLMYSQEFILENKTVPPEDFDDQLHRSEPHIDLQLLY